MDLRHLRSFIAVAEELSFRRAAERLHMSLPPLSRQIRTLEDELGVQLLERERRIPVCLTDAGRAFLVEANQTIVSAEKALRSARQAQQGSHADRLVPRVETLAESCSPCGAKKAYTSEVRRDASPTSGNRDTHPNFP
jgi:DNA-binding transcriptional LysR family regulator